MVTSPSRNRTTAQGVVVRDALRAEKAFRSAQDIYASLRSAGHSVGLSTVYRHLQSFAEQGIADVIHSADGETTYRLCGDGAPLARHHHHLVCRHCGQAEEIEGRAVERWAESVAEEYGYRDLSHTVEVFGLCPNCSQ